MKYCIDLILSNAVFKFIFSHFPFSELSVKAQNNGQQVACHDDRPNIFQPGQTPILAGQINEYYNFFFAPGISNYAGSRSLYGIVVQVFAGKLVKNSFTRCWVPFRDFRPFYVRLYIPSASSYGGVGSLQGSSYICISVKLDPFRCAARDQKSRPQRRNVTKYFQQRSWFGKKFVPQTGYLSSKVIKYTAELSFGSPRNTLSRRAY